MPDALTRAKEKPSLIAGALSILQCLVSLPFLLMKPGYFREDWLLLLHGKDIFLPNTPDEYILQARPVGALLYGLSYEYLGGHPLLNHVVLTALNATIPALLYLVMAALVSKRLALWSTVAWIALPTHVSLDHWMAAINITASLAIYLAGVLLLVRETRRQRARWASTLVLLVSVLSYGATAPVALLSAFAVPMLLTKTRKFVPSLVPAAAIVAASLYVSVASRDRPSEYGSPVDALWQNFSLGITDSVPTQVFFGALAIAAILWMIRARTGKAKLSPASRESAALILAGFAVAVVGYLPFASTGFDLQYVGVGDRCNVVSAIGVAMVFGAALSELTRRHRLVGATMTTVAVAAALVAHLDKDARWANTASYSLAAAHQVVREAGDNRTVSVQLTDEVPELLPGVKRREEVEYILRFGYLGTRYRVPVSSTDPHVVVEVGPIPSSERW